VLGWIARTAVFTLIMPTMAFVHLPALVLPQGGGARDLPSCHAARARPGEAVLFGSVALLGYAVASGLAIHAFVTLYEEPTLRARFGPSYNAYRASVPRWIPRGLVPPY
jgi:protein-S-isoprenylcysteine O-methyltransferase Ste14